MASGEIGRYSKPFPDAFKVGGLLDRDSEACRLKMLHPTSAAPAIRILVNQDVGSLSTGRPRNDQCRGHQVKCASPRQEMRMIERGLIHGLGLQILLR